MGRSLKEALLDQMALLQERGLAPSEVPIEDERPMVVVESASRGRAGRGRRDGSDRGGDRDEMGIDLLDFDRDRRRGQRRDHRPEEGRGERRRPPQANRRRGREGEGEMPIPPVSMPAFDRPMGPGGPRRGPGTFGPPRPGMGGPRPGMGGPRPGAPMGGPGRPPVGRTEIMQRRAEERRRDEADIAEMKRLLAELSGQEMDDAAMEKFSRAMTEETGALPPPRIVVAAINQIKSADPRKIGDAIRAYYRRRRAAANQQAQQRAAQSAAPAAAEAPAPEAAADEEAPPADATPEEAAADGTVHAPADGESTPLEPESQPMPVVAAADAPVAEEDEAPTPALTASS